MTKKAPAMTPVFDASRNRWRVSIPANASSDGQRHRQFFATRAEAREYVAGLSLEDTEANITQKLAAEAAEALALLRPHGLSILDAVRRVIAMIERDQISESVAKAGQLYLDMKEEGWSAIHFAGNRRLVDALTSKFGNTALSALTSDDILAFLDSNSKTAPGYNLTLRQAKAFFSWCADPVRKWCDADLLRGTKPKKHTKAQTEVLTSTECAALLAAAEKHYPETALPFAIQLFCGVRAEELTRLEACHVTDDGIEIPASASKTATRRFISMPEPLRAWILKYSPIPNQPIVPANWNRLQKAVRRLAGWRVWTDCVAEPSPPDDLPPWPQNALRHTAASLRIALGMPVEQLLFEHGHSGGVTLLRKHYLGVMTKREALEIWSIQPDGEKASNL